MIVAWSSVFRRDERTCIRTMKNMRTTGVGHCQNAISFLSPQTLCRKLPIGYKRSDLTTADFIVDRVRAWACNFSTTIRASQCARCILSCDVLVVTPMARVCPITITGIDATDFHFNYDILETLPSSSQAFSECVDGHWKF
jgi:hypothetical protein